MYFFREASDYFAPLGALLLHTWSLAIEEQFYFLMPWLLLFCFRSKPTGCLCALRWVAVLSLLSVILYFVLQSKGLSHEAFYLLPSRMWELAMGSCLALYPVVSQSKNRSWLMVVSMLLFLFALYWGRGSERIGIANLSMCCASVLMIYNGIQQTARGSMLQKILGNKVLVFFGLISYSLYLWHYPIIKLFDSNATWVGYVVGSDFSIWVPVLLSTIIALMSWKWVEQPIRLRHFLKKTISLYVFFGVVFLVFFVGSAAMVVQTMKVQVFGTGPEELVSKNCTKRGENVFHCQFTDDQKASRLLVLGNCHAGMYVPVLVDLAKQYKVNLDLGVVNDCSHLSILTPNFKTHGMEACREKLIQVLSDLDFTKGDAPYEGVLWAESGGAHDQSELEAASANLLRFFSRHADKVWVVAPPPVLDQRLYWYVTEPSWRSAILRAIFDGGGVIKFTVLQKVYDRGKLRPSRLSDLPVAYVNRDLHDFYMAFTHTLPNVNVLDSVPFFCNDQSKCHFTSEDGKWWYTLYTTHNLSNAGAFHLRPMFEPVFEKLSKRSPKSS